MSEEGHEQIVTRIRAYVPAALHDRIPPPVIRELGARFQNYVPGESLEALFPVKPQFTNMAGGVQGGILIASLDSVMGSLAFIECKAPVTSTSINTSFLRPVMPANGDYLVRAKFKYRTKQFAYTEGEVYSGSDDPCALCTMTTMILSPERMGVRDTN